MSFSTRFILLREQHGLTQKKMAARVGIHLSQVRRYESGEVFPSLDIFKRIAVAFHVSADWLIFEEGERVPQDEQKLKFEAIKQMDEREQQCIALILDAMIFRYEAKRFSG